MLATSSPSAGVYTAENNRGQRITAQGTSVGCIVGYSERGSVMERVFVTDNEDFRSLFGMKHPNLGYMHYCAESFLTQGNQLYVTRVVDGAKTGGAFITTENNFAVGREIESGYEWDRIEPSMSDKDIMFIYAENPGAWNNDVRVIFYPDTADPDEQKFVFEVYEGDSTIPAESYKCTTFRKVENGKQLFIEDVVNKNSDRIRVMFNRNHVKYLEDRESDIMNAIGSVTLNGGENGNPVKEGHILQGWDLYLDWEQVKVNMLINGGWATPAIHLHLDTIAQSREDCIAILDTPEDYEDEIKAVDYRRNVLNLNSSFSALYCPRIKMRDTENAIDVEVPPSGLVASRYVYTDRTRAPYWAPAGVDRGKLPEALGVTSEYKLGHRNALTDSQVNVIRNISGEGVCIFDACTLEVIRSPLSNVHARRLLAMLRSSVRIANLKSVFEPNTTLLQQAQTVELNELLEPIKRGRGLYWYEVVCDSRNNTPELTQNGDLIVDVYLQITEFAKRIHVNAVVAKTGQIQFAEAQLYGE